MIFDSSKILIRICYFLFIHFSLFFKHYLFDIYKLSREWDLLVSFSFSSYSLTNYSLAGSPRGQESGVKLEKILSLVPEMKFAINYSLKGKVFQTENRSQQT